MGREQALFRGAVYLRLGSHPAVSIAAPDVVAAEHSGWPAFIGTASRIRDTVEALVASQPTPWVEEARSWIELENLLVRDVADRYRVDKVFFLSTHALEEEIHERNRKHLELARDLLRQLAVHANWIEERPSESAHLGLAASAEAVAAPKVATVGARRADPRAIQLDNDDSDDSTATPPALEQARRRRDQILSQESFLSAREVHTAQGGEPDAPGAANAASRLRRNGELLGVWTGREYRYPAFQFDVTTGRAMVDRIRALLKLLPTDPSGWQQAAWMFQPHSRLNGRRPADAFTKQPDFVIELARDTFANRDAQW